MRYYLYKGNPLLPQGVIGGRKIIHLKDNVDFKQLIKELDKYNITYQIQYKNKTLDEIEFIFVEFQEEKVEDILLNYKLSNQIKGG
jgi:hypothetical protein